jgi:Uma2 family endonuclease
MVAALDVPGTHPAPYTVDEWVHFVAAGGAADGRRVELVDGSLFVSPAPAFRHQKAGDRLRDQLIAAAPDGFDVVTATALGVADGTGFVPDVLVIDEATNDDSVALSVGSVHVVVEIVSPSTRAMDRSIKPQRYAAAGVPFFWRLELLEFRGRLPGEVLPVLFVYALGADGDYELTHRFDAKEPVKVVAPFAVTVDLSRLSGPLH